MTDETHETSGKVAILTGAAVGLGRAVVTRFAHEGAAVVAVDTNVQDGRAVIEQIRKNGGCGIFVRADIQSQK